MKSQTLQQYTQYALENSPLIKDYKNRCEIQQSELQRLRALYTRSRLELTGDYLFVPIVACDNGRTALQWNAQSAQKYYGYDLGESSGHLHAGLTWSQPLLGAAHYKAARQVADIQTAICGNDISMEKHQLERTVAELYLLCLLDMEQANLSDSIACLLQRQREVVATLAKNGLAKQSDVLLVEAECSANDAQRIAAMQSYDSHLSDLNIVCGLRDTARAALSCVDVTMRQPQSGRSSFAEQYRLDSLGVLADLRVYDAQYRPQLSLFVDGGLRTSDFSRAYRHFGWSAGLTFSMTLFDGGQRKQRQAQAQTRLGTIASYRDDAMRQRSLRLRQCLDEWQRYTEREKTSQRQLEEYGIVLQNYEKEMRAGQLSVLDYITVMKSMAQTRRELLTLHANKQLTAVAYNYWNY